MTLVASAPIIVYKPRIGAPLMAYYAEPEFEHSFFPVTYPAGTEFVSTTNYIAIMKGVVLVGHLRGLQPVRRDGLGPMVYVATWHPEPPVERAASVERIPTEIAAEILQE